MKRKDAPVDLRQAPQNRNRGPAQEKSDPVIVGATPDTKLLAMLQARAGKSPPMQRELFVKECASSDAPSQLAAICAAATVPAITVVSANCYYGQCTNPITNEKIIDPARTFSAVESLIEAGADVVCMQEVLGGILPSGQGQDTYPFDFFPKEDFASWPEEAEKFAARANIQYLYAPADNSAMYRYSFGNAIAVNTKTLRIIESRTQSCLTKSTKAEGWEGRSALSVLVEPVAGGTRLVVCCTHLTEKLIGESGEKQCEMIDAVVQGTLAEASFINQPSVLCGDLNINNVNEQPTICADFCNASPFLHPHADYNLYSHLEAAGFHSGQYYAQKTGSVLNTCWNAACVDYIGSRGEVQAVAYGVVDPAHDGMVISDHRFPVGMYQANY